MGTKYLSFRIINMWSKFVGIEGRKDDDRPIGTQLEPTKDKTVTKYFEVLVNFETLTSCKLAPRSKMNSVMLWITIQTFSRRMFIHQIPSKIFTFMCKFLPTYVEYWILNTNVSTFLNFCSAKRSFLYCWAGSFSRSPRWCKILVSYLIKINCIS